MDVHGVGYLIHVPSTFLDQQIIGDVLTLYTHTHVREDALELYGLPTVPEIEFFRRLIGIAGVGPRTALGVFAVAPLGDILRAISAGDPSLLTQVAGIGKKTAELIVIKLKDKHVELADTTSGDSAHGEAFAALESLGYSANVIRQTLAQLPAESASTEEKVAAALKLLGKK